jgi:L-arabinose isomerase
MEPTPKIGVITTMADLYRRNRPELPGLFFASWQAALERAVEKEAALRFAPVVHTAEAYAAEVAALERAGCEALMVAPMAYTPSGIAVDALSGTDLPIIVVSSSRDLTLPDDMSGDHLLANQAMHGVQDLANVLWRAGRPYLLVAGHADESRFRERMQAAVRQARAASVLRRGRVGQIGGFFGGMLDFTFHESARRRHVGFEHLPLPADVLANAAAGITDDQVNEYREWMRTRFTVDAGFTDEELEVNARYALALERIVSQHGLDAVALNFLTVVETEARTLPFLGAGRLMAQGIGYAGEGDVLTATLVAALARAAGQASFTELFCPDYARGQVLLSHMGESNFAMASVDRPVLRPKEFAWGNCLRPAVPVFQYPPGVATVVGISETPPATGEPSFQLLAFTGCIEEAAESQTLTVPYSRMALSGGTGPFLEWYSNHGGTHHGAIVVGDHRETVSNVAAFLGLRLVQRDFAR